MDRVVRLRVRVIVGVEVEHFGIAFKIWFGFGCTYLISWFLRFGLVLSVKLHDFMVL